MTERATRTSTTQGSRRTPARFAALLLLAAAAGCTTPREYGREGLLWLPDDAPKSMAVAPVLNLSGQQGPDPLLQADLVYQELQQVRGLTAVPVNRTVQAMAGLGLRQIDSLEQARAICMALGVESIIVGTISAYDPYDPPKFGGSVQVFTVKQGGATVNVRDLARQPTADGVESVPVNADFIQAVRMFDASAGTTRSRVDQYAAGRVDPSGPLGVREFYLNMDRYSAFAWHELIEEALKQFED